MLKKTLWLILALAFWALQVAAPPAMAAELDEATRTVPLNSNGETMVMTRQQAIAGQRLFNYACATCHVGGITKTNPSLDLSPQTLALANPPRDNIEGLVDYLKHPTTYDGFENIAEIHPSLESADIFPKMRNLTEDDLVAIAGHILIQPKILGDKWGGGKIYY